MNLCDAESSATVIHRLDPAMKTLAISGLGHANRLQNMRLKDSIVGFLAKPFTVGDLLDAVAPLLPSPSQ